MQSTVSRFQLAAYSPDVIVEIPRNTATNNAYYRASEIIEVGRKQAERVLLPYLE